MKQMEIGYVTEDPAPAYSKAIRMARTRGELISSIRPYERVADDALRAAKAMTEDDFEDFKVMIQKAHRKMPEKWIEEFVKRFGDIAMPIKMTMTSMIADQYHAPWGTAFLRLEEDGWKILEKRT